ncbi:MAG: ribonuclease J, partial [Pelagibacteraceae bacterium]
MKQLEILNNKSNNYFLPIGGIGEIGGNNYLYSFKGEQILVDAGISFADDSLPGVDITIPDPYLFLNSQIKPKGLILTHAHEDHVGGLEYYFDKIDFPIYCNQFTFSYIKHKFKKIQNFEKKFILIKNYQEINFNNFSFQFIPTTHSIPDPCGVYFKTKDGNLFHTGDWKIDKNPLTGDPFELKNYEILKNNGIDILIGDSTNAGIEEISGSESELIPSFDKLFKDLKGRIIVTCFSSNIARLKTIISSALNNDKKIFVVGRSIKRAITTAIEEKLIDNFEILNEKLFADYSRDKVVLICTGSQGEKNSALWKIANNSHNHVKLSNKDNIIFSSKEIPGNEKSISYLKNSFSFLGLNIISDDDEFVHVSGHPSRNEMKQLYTYLQPQSLIPMHGEYMHLKKHIELAQSMNISKSTLLLSGDICELDFATKNHKVVDQILVQKLPVIQSSIVEDVNFLNERGKILYNGIVSINIGLEDNFDIRYMELLDKGFPFEYNKDFVSKEIAENFLNKIIFIKDQITDQNLSELFEDIARKVFSKHFSLKPEFLVHISR